MSVVFNIQQKLVKVPYDTSIGSKYIQDVLKGFGDTVETPIPDKYSNTISNYIDFLYDDYKVIKDKNYLKACFDMFTYFDDNNYFSYLLQQLLNNWSYLFTIVYTDITTELQWEILIHCPYDFLPNDLIKNKTFMREWEDFNKNKIIIVNGNKQYYINYDSINHRNKTKELRNYHTLDDKKTGSEYVTGYYDNGQLKYRRHYVKGEQQDLWIEWSKNGQVNSRDHYAPGNKQGLWEEWHDNGRPIFCGHYVDGEKQGLWRSWHNNGQLNTRIYFVDGEEQGLWEQWYDSGQLAFRGYFDGGKEQGLYESWYNNGQLRTLGHNVIGKKQGLWEYWYANGQLRTLGHFVDGKKQGLWEKWDENGNLINE
jgi:antitoxin component YwqK of YwqJK toxin-antitoxin module